MPKPLSGKKVLVVTPSFPFPATGAEQADRATGIEQMKRLGAEVVVIAKVSSHANTDFIQSKAQELGIRVVMVPYRFSERSLSRTEQLKKVLGKLKHPLYLDGAAYEYSEPRIQEALRQELDAFTPDVVWFEYTYLWPLYSQVRKRNIPVITRSINYEPEHFLEEDGRTFLNYLKFVPKYFGERRTVHMSDVMLAITPKEEEVYRRMGAKKVMTLPLRGLPKFTETADPLIRDRTPLHAFFMGSTYNVAHNKAALEYIVRYIAPLVEKERPSSFVFHILGKKAPSEFEKYFVGNVVYEGPKYNEDLETFLSNMDVAVVPSLMGAGQQQKVFEPLSRGFPTVTSERPIAGYPFRPDHEYIAAWTPEEFAAGLLSLDESRRSALSGAARAAARTVFSQEMVDAIVIEAIAG